MDEVLGVSPAVVYLTSPKPPYPVQYISPNAERFLGISENILKAQGGWFQLVHPEDIPPIGVIYQFERRPDGSTRMPYVRALPAPGPTVLPGDDRPGLLQVRE
ncbi:hypothetical protein [Ectothiorhodospira shaposhnikovii]|uniref:hypothetical protein n=1 Tax=Ectothiorhodospira shaposhnikovii TaxID=1054 RepID=UPI001903549C|nr:hypothetical protein [Ectothiorhodospira shaposhnikovii]